MKVLMLGWEYPPHITGGLGTACEGLTRALSAIDIGIDFVVPELIGDEHAPHMSLIDSSRGSITTVEGTSQLAVSHGAGTEPDNVNRLSIPAFLAPYWNEETYSQHLTNLAQLDSDSLMQILSGNIPQELKHLSISSTKITRGYHGDLFQEVERFAANVVLLMRGRSFDVIHAHDWITFPAAVAISRATGKPMVAHVHSLERDRCGDYGSERIIQIEHMGLEAATKVVAVSHYTASQIVREHGIERDRIEVVHNGVYPTRAISQYKKRSQWPGKIVLFLGRVTFQKGPDYFVEAAAKVVPHVPDVLFVMAGSGDMLPRMIERVNALGIGENFRFTGFLRGREVEEMFSIADLYVMPSVSEPFGLSALEAINYETPVVVSRQSGVAEVLRHSLRVDFWDIDRLADLIINASR